MPHGARALRVLVIGAGAFGGWTALTLARRGARVHLIDAWGPANARASSGGDTRIIRAGYGGRAIYTRLTTRALLLWRAHEARYRQGLLRRIGALWLFPEPSPFAVDMLRTLAAEDVRVEPLTRRDLARRYPAMDTTDIVSAAFEPAAGYLLARRACEHVAGCLTAEGGTWSVAAAASPARWRTARRARATAIALADGRSAAADAFVFACGPWLGSLFPDVIGDSITPTRQDVFYFGTPPGDRRFTDAGLPVWIEVGDRVRYGIPGSAHRGLKIADDTPGPAIDPSAEDRVPSVARLRSIRTYVRRRFPALADAPVVGAEVCQYEATPDSHFVIDRHPQVPNIWIVGGGSGHGFKMGPAVGAIVADLVLGRAVPDPAFAIARFAAREATKKWR
jgi:glycine/D-amino acid oxidase-like deaminating enzyme